MVNIQQKVELGQYYTIYNPFENPPFIKWMSWIMKKTKVILEPFAGANNIPKLLKSFDVQFKSYDIAPCAKGVIKRDTLEHFPKGFIATITNPPYLAKNRAKKMGVYYKYNKFDDLYKKSLSVMLQNSEFVGAIIPSSFINSSFDKTRLYAFVELNKTMFDDTETPVCLALFVPFNVKDTLYYRNDKYIGKISEVFKESHLILKKNNNINVKFNDPKGNIGLRAIDNTKCSSIKFVDPKELQKYKISNSSRHITIIKTDIHLSINDLNKKLERFRKVSYDIFMTTFKGLRSDNLYRRRLDYKTAKLIINSIGITQ